MLAVIAPQAAAAAEVVSASVAGLYVGEQRVVEGKVIATERDANVVKLHLGAKQPQLTIALVIGVLSRFPAAPETYYLNRMVRAAGVIEDFRGQLQMVVRDPELIYALDGGVPAAGPASSEPVINLQQRYDVLNRRVQQLEQRLRELQPATPGSPPPASEKQGGIDE
ncbi:MAG TPA: hypothetical protein VEB21_03065 [Terriglobales bacterium]|nr:hypothetical protein [Terriglobales bacterium]